MLEKQSGVEIVVGIAGGRDWWRLKAADIKQWGHADQSSTDTYQKEPISLVGSPWDGKSDITFRQHQSHNDTFISGRKIGLILKALRREIAKSPIRRIHLPDASDVRVCRGRFDKILAAIDIDLVDFILPVEIPSSIKYSRQVLNAEETVARIMEIVRYANTKRDIILRKENRLRCALEQTASMLGNGVAPLWLRRHPISVSNRSNKLNNNCYAIRFLMLSNNLNWEPEGRDTINNKRDIFDFYRDHSKTQKIRGNRLNILHQSKSEGLITEVALALLIEQGISPRNAFEQIWKPLSRHEASSLNFFRSGYEEIVYYLDGALESYFSFNGGSYFTGRLTIDEDLPDTILAALKGRKFGDIVDHPAFVNSGVSVSRVSLRLGWQVMHHKVRVFTIEQASKIFERKLSQH